MLQRQPSKGARSAKSTSIWIRHCSVPAGFSILDVVKSVKAANLILPSGNIKAGNLDYNVFTNNQFRTVEPIQDVIVKVNQQGNPVRVRDVGTVTDSSDIQTNIVHADGAKSVFLRVNKQPIANTVEVVDALRAALPRMFGIPEGVQLGISFDQSLYIRQSINNRRTGSRLIAGRSCHPHLPAQPHQHPDRFGCHPLSMLVTFIVLYFTGQTLTSSPGSPLGLVDWLMTQLWSWRTASAI